MLVTRLRKSSMAVAAASEAVREKVDNHFNLLVFLVAPAAPQGH